MPQVFRNELHDAARADSTERTLALLARGFDINTAATSHGGWTALMFAVASGHSSVARILLNKGADVSIKDEDGTTALHLAAFNGNLTMTKTLVRAGAAVDAPTRAFNTPLQFAAQKGHSEVVRALAEAGANPNGHHGRGVTTPLCMAAAGGHADVTRELLRANANPTLVNETGRGLTLPLEAAAARGHSEVVRVLLQELGIEGCEGRNGGQGALKLACVRPHIDVMTMLMDAGVVDNGTTLAVAAQRGHETALKILLQRQSVEPGGGGYVNKCGSNGVIPLIGSIVTCHPSSPRVVRRLVEAGADITVVSAPGTTLSPLRLTNVCLGNKTVQGKDATEKQLHRLEAIRRLLLQVDAVHAVSWLWQQTGVPHARVLGRTRTTSPNAMPLTLTLPILRRRTRRRDVLLAALFRYSKKVGSESARAA